MRTRVLALALTVGCVDSTPSLGKLDQAATVCGVGPTVKGIDVSYYQGTIDWHAVKADGVQFAFIRVSDGTGFIDPNFESYWSGSKAVGILHGAYQFFRPNQDPIAQADLLLSKIGGTLAPGDLPPVIDVEAADGLGPAAVAHGVKLWVDHVQAAIGRAPIIYTGLYFWRDQVGAANMTGSPLWHAQYSSASCPDIAPPWSDWKFWQYTSTGTIAGVSSAMDVNRWNGDRASLDAFVGPAGRCGDGTCGAGESSISCPEDCGPCGTIDAAGGEITTASKCFAAGGPPAYLRHVQNVGAGGGLIWTHTTADPTEANFADWSLFLAEAGKYKVEVSTPSAYAQSKQARYVLHTAAGDHEIKLDQSAADGWQSIGEFDLAAGGHQSIHLGDNTGEPVASNIQLVFDGVKLTRVDGGSGSGSGGGSGGGGGATDPHGGGCAAGGGGLGVGLALALAGLRRRRR